MKNKTLNMLRATLLAFLATTLGCASVNPAPKTVLVAGATGKTGQEIVKHLTAGGYKVRALVRDEDAALELLGEPMDYFEYVVGDVKDPEAMKAAAAGVSAVVSSIGARGKDGPDRPEMVDYLGVKNLVDAARMAKVRQFVMISSRGVTHEGHPLNKMFGDVLIWKLKGEDYLRASGLAYTVIRPGGLVNEPAGQGDIVFEQGDRTFSGSTLTISREDVAIICVEALKYPQAKFRTFEVHRTDGPPVTDWQARFASLKPDAP